MTDNNVTLVGNVTRDPEMRFLSSGQPVANFGIAINNRKKGANGEYEDADPFFFDVQAFGSLAENLSESVTKGTRVILTGRVQFRQWENDQGEKRSKVEIVADSVGPDLRWATAAVTRTPKQ